jgi:hypothetical protein
MVEVKQIRDGPVALTGIMTQRELYARIDAKK